MTTFRSQKAHKTHKLDSPGPPLRSPRPPPFLLHLRPSLAHLPITLQCAALSPHPPLRSLRLCERRSWLPSLRPPRPPRLPPIRAFFTTSEFQPIFLFPSALCQILRPPKGPKRPYFSPLPLFLAIATFSSPRSLRALRGFSSMRVHLHSSAAHLPITLQCAALSAHPPLRSLRLCERRSWPPSLRPLRSPRFPFHLFPTRLGFSRAQTTPKSQLFRGFPLFLETVAPQSSAALPQLPLAPLAPWREKTQLEESRPLPEAPRREEVLAFSLRLCFNKSREAAVRSER